MWRWFGANATMKCNFLASWVLGRFISAPSSLQQWRLKWFSFNCPEEDFVTVLYQLKRILIGQFLPRVLHYHCTFHAKLPLILVGPTILLCCFMAWQRQKVAIPAIIVVVAGPMRPIVWNIRHGLVYFPNYHCFIIGWFSYKLLVCTLSVNLNELTKCCNPTHQRSNSPVQCGKRQVALSLKLFH